jgi:phosphate transport system permease protein
LAESRAFDSTAPLTPTGNLRRRLIISRTVTGGATLAAVIAVAALAIVTWSVLSRGASVLNLNFLITDPAQFGSGGGIRSAILGSIVIVLAATVIAAPLGVLIAFYLVEFAGPGSRAGSVLRLLLDVMQGTPSIVVAVFVLGLLVIPTHTESGFAVALALAIIMLPLIARSSQEVLRTVPASLREAADSLGVERWRGIITVILPTALGGIVTGTILAVARAIGETAPVIVLDTGFSAHTSFNLFGPMPNMPEAIFSAYEDADPAGYARAWGIALVLLVLILAANVGSRLLLARSRRRMGL